VTTGHEVTLGWHLTHHARCAADRRGYSLVDVLLTVQDPEVTYTQTNYGAGRVMAQRGRLAVAIDLPSRTIVTVLHRVNERWSDEAA